MKEGDLRVWWIPQVPMKAFRQPAANVEQAILLLNTLAEYDRFQLENNVRGDFRNAGGLEVFEYGDWLDWVNEDGNDIDYVIRNGVTG